MINSVWLIRSIPDIKLKYGCMKGLLISLTGLDQWAEYPGIVPYAQSRILCNRELGPEEKSVRGVLVKGLTHTDMIVLDLFEGPVSGLAYPQHFYLISWTTGVRAEMC